MQSSLRSCSQSPVPIITTRYVLSHVRDNAWANFSAWPGEKIVDHYGTHYMTEAQFGGLGVVSSTVSSR